MKKLTQLHNFLSKLHQQGLVQTWAEDIKPRYLNSLDEKGFSLQYTINTLLSAVNSKNHILDDLIIWLTPRQQDQEEPVVNIDVINNGKVDMLVTLSVSEEACFIPDANGRYQGNNGNRFNIEYAGFAEAGELNNFVEFVNASN